MSTGNRLSAVDAIVPPEEIHGIASQGELGHRDEGQHRRAGLDHVAVGERHPDLAADQDGEVALT